MKKRFCALFPVLIFLTACASQNLKLTKQENETILSAAKQTNKSIALLIEEYEDKLTLFGLETFALYAPKSFELASEKYANAKAPSGSNSDEKRKFEILAAHHLLESAHRQKSAVKLHLKNADIHFLELQKLNTPTLLPNEFASIQQHFSELIYLIENGDPQSAISGEKELIELMIELERKTLIKTYLSKSEAFIAKAKENDAENYAPVSLEQVKSMLTDIKSFIRKNYRDRSSIKEKSDRLAQASEKLYYLAIEAKAINDDSNMVNEQKIANQFEFLQQIANLLELEPLAMNSSPNMRHDLILKITNRQNALPDPSLIDNRTRATINADKQPAELHQTITSEPIITLSPETNKAVLPELFQKKNSNDIIDNDEELEFDSVEIVE